ncbi:hypothetical protein [Bartonella bovis]|uniref:hypothetical protein n=1 Tax=Bartonella bovis TaxID=155194 RepID=UPI0012603982|nr:hypothetical protein [Bartonella bovis]
MRAFLVSSGYLKCWDNYRGTPHCLQCGSFCAIPIKKADKVEQCGFRAVLSLHTMLIYPDYLNNRDKGGGLCVFCPLV